MSVNEYSAYESAAATTHAAIFILSVHGVFEASALISTTTVIRMVCMTGTNYSRRCEAISSSGQYYE